MNQPADTYFSAWESFYVIVGSSAGALTGLQFVVMALVAESPRRSTSHEVGAFGTPIVVHFCAVLLVAELLSAPWHRLSSAGLWLGILGAAGVAYVILVVRRARRQTGYRPVWEDWIWHAVLPLLAYAALLVSALTLAYRPVQSLFAVGTVAVLLVFIGIHNAWDTVTYVAVEQRQGEKGAEEE
jgi:hypothetical protein